MRKALIILGCIAVILLVADIGLTVFTSKTAMSEASSFMNHFEERAGDSIE